MPRRGLRVALVLSFLVGCGDTTSPTPAAGVGGAGGGGGAGGVAGTAGAGGGSSGAAGSSGSPAGQGGAGGAGAAGGGQAGSAVETQGGSAGSAAGELPCDVEHFLKKRCQFCHADPPKYGSPLPLMTLADLRAPSFSDPSRTAAVVALDRIQDKKDPMPEPPNPPATAAEVALLKAWIDAGYPPRAGDTCDAAAGAAGAAGSGSSGQAGSSSTGGQGGSASGAGGAGGAGGSPGGAGGGVSGSSGQAGAGGPAGAGGAGGSDAGAGGSAAGGGGASAGQGGQSGSGPAGQGGGAGQAGSGAAGQPTVCPDVEVAPSVAWQMPADVPDQYICYGFEVPTKDFKRHMVSVSPKIANDTIVHHLLLLSAPTAQPTTPSPCESLPPLDWRLLYAWAPGTPELQLPSEAGYPIEQGETMHLVMQVHYSNLKKLSGQVDSSGVSLCTTSQLRPYDADVMAFGSLNFSLGPHQTTKLRCASDAPTSTSLRLFQSWPHMHTLGTQFGAWVRRPDGTEVPMATAENYSFYNQITYPHDIEVKPGDQIFTSCTWDNPTGDKVTFGEATSEEMCFNFVSYYPRIEASWSWLFPAYSSQCEKVP